MYIPCINNVLGIWILVELAVAEKKGKNLFLHFQAMRDHWGDLQAE